MTSVQDYMNARMVMRDSKASVLEFAKVMVDWNVSSVAITDEEQNNKIIGILTELDIVKSIAKGVPPEGIAASSIMSSSILSVRKDQPIEEAALIMIRNKVRHLLVEDSSSSSSAQNGGVIIGIITTTDLARYLKKRMKEATITAAAAREDEKEEEEQKQQQQSSPELLLSEVWELYF
jgi:predicted transcriptional regulator